jgi:hypothetical protein
MKYTEKHLNVIRSVREYVGKDVASRYEVKAAVTALGIKSDYFLYRSERRVGRGEYSLVAEYSASPATKKAAPKAKPAPVAAVAMAPQVAYIEPRPVVESLNIDSNGFEENLVPEKDPLYIAFGNFADVKKIIASSMFFPVYITGLSGNGKTFMVEQACAELKREMIRVNFTVETDEDDLIGGFRLVNGETKFFKGPVIKAMERGAVALLDEIDLANPAKIMCLQSILEGKGYFIKKTGEYIKPAKGFTILATANTKGRGSEDGKFIGTNIMNEAFLERFNNTYEQEYPPVATEKKILTKLMSSLGIDDLEFATKLTDWADVIRKTYMDGGVDEIISTRRLVHIVNTYFIFGDRMESITKCINRFDDDTKEAFADLYTKIDSGVLGSESEEVSSEPESTEETPF